LLLLRIKVLFKNVPRFQSGHKLHGFHTFFVDGEYHGVVDKLNSVEWVSYNMVYSGLCRRCCYFLISWCRHQTSE